MICPFCDEQIKSRFINGRGPQCEFCGANLPTDEEEAVPEPQAPKMPVARRTKAKPKVG